MADKAALAAGSVTGAGVAVITAVALAGGPRRAIWHLHNGAATLALSVAERGMAARTGTAGAVVTHSLSQDVP